jgi:hypothetical protein
MQPKQLAALVVTVFFRTAAVCTALFGMFLMAMPLLMAGFGASWAMLRMLVVYLGAAVVLWLLSRPMAALVVAGLGDDAR